MRWRLPAAGPRLVKPSSPRTGVKTMVGTAMITVLMAQITAFDGCSLIQAMDRAAICRILVIICPILVVGGALQSV